MANVFIYKNENLKHVEEFLTTPLAAAVAKGDLLLTGGKPGIFDDDYAAGTSVVSVSRGGQFRVLVSDVAGASAPVAAGTEIHINAVTNALTTSKDSGGGSPTVYPLVGHVVGNDPLTAGDDVVTVEMEA
jgi:hypothetical protein